MLECEGYKMFEGEMVVTPKGDFTKSIIINGTWLYKPDCKCWYCKGSSYPEEICQISSVKHQGGSTTR